MTTQEPNYMNITSSAISGECDLKCALNFDYQTTSLVATNNGIQISLQVDNQNTPPVTFNSEQLKAINFTITSQSSFLYNGVQAPGEIGILHESVNGGPILVILIPLYESTNSNSATDLITEIITNVASSAPSDGEQTTINLNNFSLQNIVPEKPFYTYSIGEVINVVVYGINNGIPLTQSTLSTLSSILTATPLTIFEPGTELFYNKLGPNLSGSGEGIYISCNPTGTSESTTDVQVKNSTTSTTNDLGNMFNNPLIVQVFFGCLIFIAIFFFVSLFFNILSGKTFKMPNYLETHKSSAAHTSTS